MPIVDSYFGSDLTKRDYWTLEMQLHEQHREGEVELMASRWFDYRQMLPAQATYLFAAQYRHEYLEAYKRTVDVRTVDAISPFAPDDIFKSRELVPMWLARREADRIGCKYDFYLRLTFDRFADRGWRNLPRPSQLYTEELTLDIRDAWMKRCREVMQLAESKFYSLDWYVSHPDQDDYHDYLIKQIAQREHKHLALSCVFKNDALPVELAGKTFGADLIKRAHHAAQH